MSQVERFTIAKLRYAGGSEHYVRYVSEVHYDASLAREAALQQRLTVADQRIDELAGKLGEAYQWGYGDGQNNPNGYGDKADRDNCVAEMLKPAEEVEALGTRPVGCCCPPKGHTGIWAAAMCPVHFGLKRPGSKP